MRNDSKIAFAVASRQIELCRLEIRRALIEKETTSKEYNPNQPRIPARHTGAGRWTDGGTTNLSPPQKIVNARKVPLFSLAASQEDCDEQYRRDLIVCKFTGLRACYAQAMVRLVACERGHSIPPLNF